MRVTTSEANALRGSAERMGMTLSALISVAITEIAHQHGIYLSKPSTEPPLQRGRRWLELPERSSETTTSGERLAVSLDTATHLLLVQLAAHQGVQVTERLGPALVTQVCLGAALHWLADVASQGGQLGSLVAELPPPYRRTTRN